MYLIFIIFVIMGVLTISFSNDLRDLLFKGTDIANIGDATGIQGSSPTGNGFEIALFKNDGDEANYTGYERIRLDYADWDTTTSNQIVYNANEILFGENTGGTSNVIASYRVYYGRDVSDGGTVNDYTNVIWEQSFTATKTISNGESPKINQGDIYLSIT